MPRRLKLCYQCTQNIRLPLAHERTTDAPLIQEGLKGREIPRRHAARLAKPDVGFAFVASGVAMLATVGLGMLFPLHADKEVDTDSVDIGYEPEVGLGLSLRSGPVVIEVEYDVDPEQAREFYGVMVRLQRARNRIGACMGFICGPTDFERRLVSDFFRV